MNYNAPYNQNPYRDTQGNLTNPYGYQPAVYQDSSNKEQLGGLPFSPSLMGKGIEKIMDVSDIKFDMPWKSFGSSGSTGSSGFTGTGSNANLFSPSTPNVTDAGYFNINNAAPQTAADVSKSGLGAGSGNMVTNAVTNFAAGYIGDYVGKLAGFDKTYGSDVGGMVGGFIGSAGGPLGTAAGAFLGRAVGSLFGGKKDPHPASSFVAQIGDTGDLTNTNFRSKHIDNKIGQASLQESQQYFKGLQQALGVNLSGTKLYGGYDNGKYFIGTNFAYGKGAEEGAILKEFDPKDRASMYKAYQEVAEDLLIKQGKWTPQRAEALRMYKPELNRQSSTYQVGKGSSWREFNKKYLVS